MKENNSRNERRENFSFWWVNGWNGLIELPLHSTLWVGCGLWVIGLTPSSHPFHLTHSSLNQLIHTPSAKSIYLFFSLSLWFILSLFFLLGSSQINNEIQWSWMKWLIGAAAAVGRGRVDGILEWVKEWNQSLPLQEGQRP